jgi:1-acyl-sn-glycerol-3-phosphate acyltransferase
MSKCLENHDCARQNVVLYRVLAFLCRVFLNFFYPYRVEGIENLDKVSGGYILCSNHISNLDALFLVAIHKKNIYFMAKSELFKIKIFGKFLGALGVFPIHRGKGDKTALTVAENILKKGNVLGVFVEGRRSKTGEFLKPKSGAAFLANQAKAGILPVCITGGSNGNKIKIFKYTKIAFGEPILHNDLDIENNFRGFKKAAECIMEKIASLRDQKTKKQN